MKLHYSKDFNSFETTECHKTDIIELDGIILIPITEFEEIKTEIKELEKEWDFFDDYRKGEGLYYASKIIDKHIEELKRDNKQTDVSVDPYEMKYIRCEKGE